MSHHEIAQHLTVFFVSLLTGLICYRIGYRRGKCITDLPA